MRKKCKTILAILTMENDGSFCYTLKVRKDDKMNEVIKTLCERRSCRKYLDKKIPEEDLEWILKCGTYAPNGKNQQSPRIVVIDSPDLIAKIAKINGSFIRKEGINPFYNAPVLLIVFADKTIPTYLLDGAAVLTNMANAAYSLGIDSCWVHRAKETFETEEGKELMQKWGLNENYEGIGNLVLGYRDGPLLQAKERKPDYIIYDEKR